MTVRLGDPGWREGFESFYRIMPDHERRLAIEALRAADLPTSEEFIRAYAIGFARAMSVMLDDDIGDDEPAEETDAPGNG